LVATCFQYPRGRPLLLDRSLCEASDRSKDIAWSVLYDEEIDSYVLIGARGRIYQKRCWKWSIWQATSVVRNRQDSVVTSHRYEALDLVATSRKKV